MQLLEVVTGHSQFLSHFSIPQAMPTQPVKARLILTSRLYDELSSQVESTYGEMVLFSNTDDAKF